ncbi:hypothetical protein A2U01_0027043 [Trifolium medium]|uniref:Uncharacterized protein n=1 Tax=Trifolium medium TaxID=97028 RepID=A0A392P1W6_9FABA|nr:hypothetical protein [Trifolium medium]
MSTRHSSVHETSRFQPMPFRSSSFHESGSSSRFAGQTYQEDDNRPSNVDLNRPASQLPPINTAATLREINIDMMSDDFVLDAFLSPYDNQGNQGNNKGRSQGGHNS